MKNTKEKKAVNEAVKALNKIKTLMSTGKISYDNAKFFATPYLETVNAYGKARAKEAGLSFRATSFSGFMR